MGILQIATMGEDASPIMIGVREYPVSHLVLLHTPEFAKEAERVKLVLEPLRLETTLVEVRGDVVTGVLRAVSDLVNEHGPAHEDVCINVSSGTRLTGCAVTAAAFVNGVKAFAVTDGKPAHLPVLKFSYRELVSDAKLTIMRAIRDAPDGVDSLTTLSRHTGMDKSLLSYHLRGGRESKGLEALELVRIERGARGRLGITLTPMGRTLLAACNELVARPRPPPEG